MTILRRILLFALTLTALVSLASAEVDSGNYQLYEGDNILVGVVWVPARATGQTQYEEHWVLFPGYVHPAPSNLTTLRIVPTLGTPYSDLNSFIRAVWRSGSTYVHVRADESTMPPVR